MKEIFYLSLLIISRLQLSIEYSNNNNQQRKLKIGTPTLHGTQEYKTYPNFILQDYSPSSKEKYMSSYGIDDIKPPGDVTIVGLYYSDSELSQAQAPKQEQLGNDLTNLGYNVVNIALNNYAPKSCASESECEPVMWYLIWYPWYSSQCQDYIDGCPPNDPRLHSEVWQKPFTDVTSIPLFQDKEWQNSWDKFGGGENDLFIYDSEGKLFKYICSSTTCGSSSLGTITTNTGYEYTKSIAVQAATSNSTTRCSLYSQDDWYSGYSTISDYYYYYGDDAKQGLFKDDEMDSSSSSSSSSFSNYGGIDDDDAFVSPDIEYHDLVSAKIQRRQTYSKHPVITSTVYAGVLALAAILVTFGVLYYRYKSKYQDDDLTFIGFDTIDGSDNGDGDAIKRSSAKVSRIASYGASNDIEKAPTSYTVY